LQQGRFEFSKPIKPGLAAGFCRFNRVPVILLYFAIGMNALAGIAKKSWFLWLIYAVMALFISIRSYYQPLKTMPGFEGKVTTYNNYILFHNSFGHLTDGKNLYAGYPSEQYDVFKYSPTFAMAFGPFAALPKGLGLILWNGLNALVFVFAIKQLKLPPIREMGFGLLGLQEAFTTTANSQSNMLIAGLLILAYVNLEKGKTLLPVFLISITVFIKLFGVLFFALVLLYPQRWRCVLPAIGSMALLFFMVLPVAGWQRLWQHYREYGALLAGDHGYFVKYSVMGWLQSWFGLQPNKNWVVILGLMVQLLPLLWIKRFNEPLFRTIYTASWLIWMVIFNHMAESATFIIAVAGVLLWYFSQESRYKWQIVLLLPVILFTCFGPSDIYPKAWRSIIVEDWQLKVFPCIVIWCVCMGQLVLSGLNQQLQK